MNLTASIPATTLQVLHTICVNLQRNLA